MTEADRQVIRDALEELNSSPILDDDRLSYREIQVSPDYRDLLESALAILDADKPEGDAPRLKLGSALKVADAFRAERDAAQEEVRMMQERLQRHVDAKPTVPMALIRAGWMLDPEEVRKVAAEYGYKVTETPPDPLFLEDNLAAIQG